MSTTATPINSITYDTSGTPTFSWTGIDAAIDDCMVELIAGGGSGGTGSGDGRGGGGGGQRVRKRLLRSDGDIALVVPTHDNDATATQGSTVTAKAVKGQPGFARLGGAGGTGGIGDLITNGGNGHTSGGTNVGGGGGGSSGGENRDGVDGFGNVGTNGGLGGDARLGGGPGGKGGDEGADGEGNKSPGGGGGGRGNSGTASGNGGAGWARVTYPYPHTGGVGCCCGMCDALNPPIVFPPRLSLPFNFPAITADEYNTEMEDPSAAPLESTTPMSALAVPTTDCEGHCCGFDISGCSGPCDSGTQDFADYYSAINEYNNAILDLINAYSPLPLVLQSIVKGGCCVATYVVEGSATCGDTTIPNAIQAAALTLGGPYSVTPIECFGEGLTGTSNGTVTNNGNYVEATVVISVCPHLSDETGLPDGLLHVTITGSLAVSGMVGWSTSFDVLTVTSPSTAAPGERCNAVAEVTTTTDSGCDYDLAVTSSPFDLGTTDLVMSPADLWTTLAGNTTPATGFFPSTASISGNVDSTHLPIDDPDGLFLYGATCTCCLDIAHGSGGCYGLFCQIATSASAAEDQYVWIAFWDAPTVSLSIR